MPTDTLGDWGERGWLSFLREVAPAGESGQRLVLGPGDDAALYQLPGAAKLLVLTSDALIAGTHFQLENLDWGWLARKAVLAAASDVTAMGGIPTGFLCALGAPSKTPVSGLRDFANELARLRQDYGLALMGGDTVQSPVLMVDITVMGEVAPEDVLLATSGQPGDALWVSGCLGRARLDWAASPSPGWTQPGQAIPPVRWSCLSGLREALPLRALTDLSDGLALDLEKICHQHGLGYDLDLSELPVHEEVWAYAEQAGVNAAEFAFCGGEDYELLVVEAGHNQPTRRFEVKGLPFTRIGVLTEDSRQVRWEGEPHTPQLQPFDHYHYRE